MNIVEAINFHVFPSSSPSRGYRMHISESRDSQVAFGMRVKEAV